MITYSISQDIISQTCLPSKLDSEIRNSNSVFGYAGLSVSDDTITITCDTVVDQSALDDTIHNHVAVALSDNKKQRVISIDHKTDEIIANGFDYDGQRFSLSIEAQMNWSGLYTFQAIFSWPMGVTTLDNTTYALAQASLIPFIIAGSTVVATAVGTGRAIKMAALAATTQAELDAVVDSR